MNHVNCVSFHFFILWIVACPFVQREKLEAQLQAHNATTACLNQLPIFTLIPNVLPLEDLSAFNELVSQQPGQKQWYGRTTYWKESFTAKIDAHQQLTVEHPTSHFSNVLIDRLTEVFLKTFNVMC